MAQRNDLSTFVFAVLVVVAVVAFVTIRVFFGGTPPMPTRDDARQEVQKVMGGQILYEAPPSRYDGEGVWIVCTTQGMVGYIQILFRDGKVVSPQYAKYDFGSKNTLCGERLKAQKERLAGIGADFEEFLDFLIASRYDEGGVLRKALELKKKNFPDIEWTLTVGGEPVAVGPVKIHKEPQ